MAPQDQKTIPLRIISGCVVNGENKAAGDRIDAHPALAQKLTAWNLAEIDLSDGDDETGQGEGEGDDAGTVAPEADQTVASRRKRKR